VLSRVQLIREEDAHQNLVTAHDTESESWGRSTELDDACDSITDQVKFSDTVEGWQSAYFYIDANYGIFSAQMISKCHFCHLNALIEQRSEVDQI